MPLSFRLCTLMILTIAVVAGWAAGTVSGQTVRGTVDSTASIIHYPGTAPLHDWTGTSRRVDGRVVLVPNRPDSSRAVIRVPVASFDSGNDRRDRKMREVTEVAQYPIVEFRTTALQPVTWGRASEGHAGRWKITGTLAFHGRTDTVKTTADVRITDEQVRVRAQFPIRLSRFEVERPSLLWASIDDTIRIDARIVGTGGPASVGECPGDPQASGSP